jgi:hypothetical protein
MCTEVSEKYAIFTYFEEADLCDGPLHIYQTTRRRILERISSKVLNDDLSSISVKAKCLAAIKK